MYAAFLTLYRTPVFFRRSCFAYHALTFKLKLKLTSAGERKFSSRTTFFVRARDRAAADENENDYLFPTLALKNTSQQVSNEIHLLKNIMA